MWAWIGIGVLSAIPFGYDYFFGDKSEPEPVTDPNANLLRFSLMLGIAVSVITLYQFWKGR